MGLYYDGQFADVDLYKIEDVKMLVWGREGGRFEIW